MERGGASSSEGDVVKRGGRHGARGGIVAREETSMHLGSRLALAATALATPGSPVKHTHTPTHGPRMAHPVTHTHARATHGSP